MFWVIKELHKGLVYKMKLEDIRIRDPYVLPIKERGIYYVTTQAVRIPNTLRIRLQ